MITIRDVYGREREARVYLAAYDGCDGYACPFCGSVTVDRPGAWSRWPRCDNPWCTAAALPDDPGAETIRAAFVAAAHDAALRIKEEERRAQLHEWRMNYVRERAEAREQAYRERRTEAQRRGACARCATRDMERPARYVKHRSGRDCGPLDALASGQNDRQRKEERNDAAKAT